MKPRILLVEDETVLREHLASALSNEFLVDTAADGEAALHAVLRNRPDLVATDIVMPGIDGVELVKTLRNTPSTSTIPILMISGRAPEELRLQGFEFGADSYLAKPYTERELRVRIRALLRAVRNRVSSARAEERERAVHDAMAERAALLESITDAFYAVDRQWRVTYMNQRALDYFRRTRDELVGKNIWNVFPVAKGSPMELGYHRAMEQRRAESFEFRSPVTGQWVEVHAYPTPQGLAINFRDITERKFEKQALIESEERARQLAESHRQSEERYRLFVTNSTDGIWRYEVDPPMDLSLSVDDQIKYIYEHAVLAELNHAMARMYGYERAEDLAGARVSETLPPTAETFAYLRSIAAAKYSVVDAESVERDRYGNVRHFSNSLVPTIQDGKLLRAWGTQRDITDRKLAEQALRENERRKDEFLAILAHELRNPLAPIRNGVQILRYRAAVDPTAQQTLAMMDRQMTHLVRLVDDLLDVGRINSGHLELRREDVLLADVLATAVESAREAILNQGHTLNVANTDETLGVHADPNRLAQIFSNLLLNAAKYSDRGGVINVELRREGEEAVISVQDTGIGIPPPELDNVFDMFAKVSAHQGRAGGGLGIGLALVRTLVQMHGGSVCAFSEGSGQGSTFTVRLPLSRTQAVSRNEAITARPPNSAASGRVLVVDDNTDAARSLALLLEFSGAEVRVASDGEEAIGVASTFSPQIIFMDLGMPRMDGVEATQRIRSLPAGRDMFIVALTGWGLPADRERTRVAGFDLHLVKPVSAEALDKALESARLSSGM